MDFTSEDKFSLDGCEWVNTVEQNACLRCFPTEDRISVG